MTHSSARNYIAIDLGASSGRGIVGEFDGSRVAIQEVHRFDNGPVHVGQRMYWDVLHLWSEIQNAMRLAGNQYGDSLVSIGVDTWGVDFALLDKHDQLLANPFHYRDRHTVGIFDQAFKKVPREEIFAATGLQFMEINSLYQLIAMQRDQNVALENAKTFLLMPDLFHWMLSGEMVNELTDASTTQLFDPQLADWSEALIRRFGFDRSIFQTIAEPGTRIGSVRPTVLHETRLKDIDVVLPGAHDTASAILSVPASTFGRSKPDWCFISSGTWSLMGVEIDQPLLTSVVSDFNFTNEGGVGGTTRLLKNIAGLWLVQECRRIWEREGLAVDWSTLISSSLEAKPLLSVINPDDPRFLAPDNMPQAICDFCSQTNQTEPSNRQQIVRISLESLALRYRKTLDAIETMIDSKIDTIHIVGGGALNELLCQWAADACNRQVVAGPTEATALGNVMMQAVADQTVGNIEQARTIIRNSFEVQVYEPGVDRQRWDQAFEQFDRIS
jgi:rhamnulokinase